MNKLFIAVLIITSTMLAYSIELTEITWPSDVGDSWDYYANDSDYDLGYTLPGTPPWNLTAAPQDRTVTKTGVEPSTAPGGGSFPTATSAMWQQDPNMAYDTYTFHNSDANGYYLLGTRDQDPSQFMQTIPFNSPLTVMPFPLQMGTTWSDSTTYTFIFLNYPVTITGEVVAEGEVLVPYGTRTALLARVMSHISMPFGEEMWITSYQWAVPNVGSIASAYIDDDGTPTPETFSVVEDMLVLNTAVIPNVSIESASVGKIKSLYR